MAGIISRSLISLYKAVHKGPMLCRLNISNAGSLHHRSVRSALLPVLKPNIGQHLSLRYLSIGDQASLSRVFTQADIAQYASLTGDHNPLHVDPEYASRSVYGRCVVHGTLTLGLVSGLVATQLPGPGSVLIRQDIQYPAPLYVDQCVKVTVSVTQYRKHIVKLAVTCSTENDLKVVLKGTIDVMYKDNKT